MDLIWKLSYIYKVFNGLIKSNGSCNGLVLEHVFWRKKMLFLEVDMVRKCVARVRGCNDTSADAVEIWLLKF